MTQLDPRLYLERIKGELVPVAAPQQHVCSTCRSGANPGYECCYQCDANRVVQVLPISMSYHGGLLHSHLRNYKDGSPQQRTEYTLRLAALLWLFLKQHQDCIGGDYDAVVTVPSTRTDRDAPKATIDRIVALRHLHVPLTCTETGPRPAFAAPEELEGKRVLLLDDTFTRGIHITAAQDALAREGAHVLLPVVIGRHFRPHFPANQYLAACHKQFTWELDRCGICGPIVCAGAAQQTLVP